MEECPNCGSKEMMWNSEDSDGILWWYCLNEQCIELHPSEGEEE
jgi:hypothetical protein